jgi:hypothetical protein
MSKSSLIINEISGYTVIFPGKAAGMPAGGAGSLAEPYMANGGSNWESLYRRFAGLLVSQI